MQSDLSPEIFKTMCRRPRIAHRMRDIAVSEIILNQARIVTLIRQIIAGRMPQHMRINFEIKFRSFADLLDQIIDRLSGQHSAFAQKKVI